LPNDLIFSFAGTFLRQWGNCGHLSKPWKILATASLAKFSTFFATGFLGLGRQRRRREIFVELKRKKIFKLRQERHLRHMANTYTQIYICSGFA
jgi:hypothetical protein